MASRHFALMTAFRQPSRPGVFVADGETVPGTPSVSLPGGREPPDLRGVIRPPRSRPRWSVALALVLPLLSGPASAEQRVVVPPDLQRSAAMCLGEALRLCPAALTAKDHGLSCILGKRRSLTAPCRVVYDQGLRLLQGRDLHLTLRRPGVR